MLETKTLDQEGEVVGLTIDLMEIHHKVRDYAYQLGVRPELLEIKIGIWGHWDAVVPVYRLLTFYGEGNRETCDLTEGRSITTIEELDVLVGDLSEWMRKEG